MGYCTWCPYLNKWITFTASICVALCCGLTYAFPIWSGALKSAYNLRQDQLELIASFSNAGGYFGIFSGFTFDALLPHKKFGPRFVLALGLLANAGGYLGLWAAVSGRLHAQFWMLLLLAFVAANGGTWGDTSILVSNVRNFPSSRGSAVGVLKAAIGLSGSLFAAVYSGVFFPDKAAFLLFLALAPVAVGLLALPFINRCEFVQRSELESRSHVFTAEGRFIFALQALGTLGVYLVTGATLGALYPLSQSARLTVTVGAGLLLLPLLLIPYGSGGLLSHKAHVTHALSHYPDQEAEDLVEDPNAPIFGSAARGRGGGGRGAARDEEQGGGGAESSLAQPLLDPGMERGEAAGAGAADGGLEPAVLDSDAPGVPDLISLEPAVLDCSAPAPPQHATNHQHAGHPPAPAAAALRPRLPPELGPGQCLRTPDFWLLFACLSIGMGSGLTLLNNLAQLVKALTGGASAREVTPVLVSLFSVCNCAGRMALGYFPERLLHQRGTPRLLFLPIVAALMAATCLALGFARLPLLYPLCALCGLCFGGFWTLFPSLVSELFGLSRFAANYTLAQFAPMLGSFGLAAGLAGFLYERALHRHGAAEGNTCVGQDCFSPTFFTLAALGLAGTAAAAALLQRCAGVYAAEYRELRSYDQEVLNHRGSGVAPGATSPLASPDGPR